MTTDARPHAPATEASEADGPPVGADDRRLDWLAVALSAWLLVGLVLDGWAHQYRPALETFFTPWHGILYSGFAATAGFYFLMAALRVRTVGPAWRIADLWRPGYRGGAVGLAIFAVGGFSDVLWHTFRGIEVDTAALLSPPHLLLLTGSFLVVGAPVRSALNGRDGVAFRVVDLAASLSLTLVSFFLMVLVPQRRFPGMSPRRMRGEEPAAEFWNYNLEAKGLGSLLLSAVLVQGTLLVVAHTRRRFGATDTFWVLAPYTLAMAALGNFRLVVPSAVALAVSVAAVWMVSWLLALRRDVPVRSVALVVAGTTYWAGFMLGGALSVGIHWPAELWGGALVWVTLLCTFLVRCERTQGEAW